MVALDDTTVRRLAVGDALAIFAFVTVGEYQHSSYFFHPARLGELAAQLAGAAVPFLLGWIVAGVALGAYREGVLDSPLRLVAYTVGPWLVADLVGQLLRSTAFFPGDASSVFFAVAAVFGSLFLLAWRTVARYTVAL